jgi:hypothetical protein
MTVFNRTRIEKGTAPQTVWQMIKDLLVINQSVELIVTEETDMYSEFELRAWDGFRQDRSNGPDATPGDNF